MSVTVLEALENAEYNVNHNAPAMIWRGQLHNAIVLLQKGYSPHEEVEPLLERYGRVENVPEKEEE